METEALNERAKHLDTEEIIKYNFLLLLANLSSETLKFHNTTLIEIIW